MASLKANNLKYLAGLLIVDVTLSFLAFPGEVHKNFTNMSPQAGGAGALFLAAMLLSWLIPSELRESLVFWRIRHVLPGHRAFSELIWSDERIDVDRLKARVGEFPKDPSAQNRLWYRLLKKHEKNDEGIAETHQRFLFFRDAAGLSFLLAVTTAIIAVIIQNAPAGGLAVFLLAQYLLFVVTGRNAANRLIVNVLAVEAAGEG